MRYEYFVLILRSMVLNYPILHAWGYVIGMPIVLAFDDMSIADGVLRQISDSVIILDDSMNEKEAREAVHHVNSRAVAYFMNGKSQKTEKRLAMLEKLSSKGKENGCVTFIIISAKSVMEDLFQRYLVFYIAPNILKMNYGVTDVVPQPESLELIHDKLLKMQGDVELKAFYGAVWFLYPKLSRKNEKLFQRLLHYVPRIIEEADSFADSQDAFNVVCHCLVEYARQGGFEPLIALPDVEREVIDDMDAYAFWHDDVLYISEIHLREIMQFAMRSVPYINVMASLLAHHALTADRGGYTKKMQYITPAGEVCRHRMLAIRIDKIKTKEGRILEYEL